MVNTKNIGKYLLAAMTVFGGYNPDNLVGFEKPGVVSHAPKGLENLVGKELVGVPVQSNGKKPRLYLHLDQYLDDKGYGEYTENIEGLNRKGFYTVKDNKLILYPKRDLETFKKVLEMDVNKIKGSWIRKYSVDDKGKVTLTYMGDYRGEPISYSYQASDKRPDWAKEKKYK